MFNRHNNVGIIIVILNIEIINSTRGVIVIFFSENKRECGEWGANSSPGCRPSANWLN